MLIDATKELLREYAADKPENESLPNVIVPTSFNFPHAGKLLALTFILFAGWFADVVVAGRDYPKLAGTGLLVLFGNINVAVPFLLDLFGIPADTFHLFIVTSVVNARFGTLVAAVAHHRGRPARYLGAGRRLARGRPPHRPLRGDHGAARGLHRRRACRRSSATRSPNEYEQDKVIAKMQLLVTREPAISIPAQRRRAVAATSTAPAHDRIRQRGTLRVGYLPDSLPFVYENASGRLVGFDVEMAHELARDLAVKLELVPVERSTIDHVDAATVRPRDVGPGGDRGSGAERAALDGVPRRDPGLHRPGSPAIEILAMGRDPCDDASSHRCPRGAVLHAKVARGAAAGRDRADRRHDGGVRPRIVKP